MSNKLQELTDKLYNEGLSKGKQEGEEMRSKAKAEAAKILADARKEAEKIISEAEKRAEDTKSKTESDIRMAGIQTISSIKRNTEDMIVAKSLTAPIKSATSDAEFIKSLISTIIKAFNPANAEPVSLDIILPAALQTQLSSFMEKECKDAMAHGLTVSYSKQMSGGFKIGPKDGGYKISFSDSDFEKVFADYLRPATKKLLFG